ncbi:MAG: PDZ domain-containing protein [Planctomycetota bacterium]|nr:MAG: PDZ domain-containing protein [Planctomycetota bacterium]
MTRRFAALPCLFGCVFVLPAAAQEGPPRSLERTLARALPCTVRVHGAGGFQGVPAYGTGVLVDERGYVLTAWSVALRTDSLRVVDHRGRSYGAVVWKADPGLGAALLKLEAEGSEGFSALRLGDSGRLRPGEPLVSLSNPFGFLYGDERPAVLRGVFSGVLRPRRSGYRVLRLPERLDHVLIHDIPNNPGTQGGPLLTLRGELVGIQGRLAESRATNTLVNYALPSSLLREFLREGLAAPRAQSLAPAQGAAERRRPPAVGAVLQRAYLIRPPLAYVERVVPGSPAERAGLRPDDLVVRLGERTIYDCRDYDEALASAPRGRPLPLLVKRGDAVLALELEVPAEEER